MFDFLGSEGVALRRDFERRIDGVRPVLLEYACLCEIDPVAAAAVLHAAEAEALRNHRVDITPADFLKGILTRIERLAREGAPSLLDFGANPLRFGAVARLPTESTPTDTDPSAPPGSGARMDGGSDDDDDGADAAGADPPRGARP